MAVNTQGRRLSVMGLCGVRTLPVPDGTIRAGDRQHLLMLYSGIDSAMSADVTGDWTLQPRDITLTLAARDLDLTLHPRDVTWTVEAT